MTHKIEAYFGTYLGISPTDESKIGLGEMEIKVGENGFSMRHASGFRIDEHHVNLGNLRPLADGEIQEIFNNRVPYNMDGFQIENGPILLFSQEREEGAPRLYVRFGFIDMLGPTVLFDNEQVKTGIFDDILKDAVESVGEYPIPRLEYGGRHQPESV